MGAGGVDQVGPRGQGPVVGAGGEHLVVGAAGGLEPVVAAAQGREVARTGHPVVGMGLEVVEVAGLGRSGAVREDTVVAESR
jgi:hypothetical protein